MVRIIILSGVEHGFKVFRLQVVELLGQILFLRCRELRFMYLFQDISASDWS